MESSQFSDSHQDIGSMEPMNLQGATCDAFRVKLFGKLHFLKRLKAEYANDIRYQEAFRKEFETGYRLEHPHLVRYISFSEDGILMEYVDGETLSERLSANPEYFKSRKNTDKLLSQLLSVVGYLHSHQVLHFDLKPDNILLTRINDDVKLIDLGCCYTDTFTDTGGYTEAFAAPEQLSGGVADVRTDIYAIGKILELLPDHHIYNKVAQRCTQHDPARRYQSVADMQRAVFPKKRPLLWLFLMILVILLTSAYFIFTSKEHPSPVLTVPQEENRHEEMRATDLPPATGEAPETVFVKETVSAVVEKKEETVTQKEQPTSSVALGPIKRELSKEEEEFVNQPHLHIVTQEEFTRYKQQMDEYYSEVNAFLADTTNFQKYPSHIAYMSQYQEIIWRMMERINADEWFHPLFESPMNPVSSYTREYKSEVEHRAFLNGNKLP